MVEKGGPQMTAKLWCIALLASLFVMGINSPVEAQSESKEDLAKYYESCIVKKIYNCKGKTVLKTSRSVNLQRKANLATKQVTFLTTNKNILIEEMVEEGISPKRYKVEYYLNKRFYEMYR
jgi:hypothetical protein